MPDVKKYLNRDGLEEYNSLLPHSSAEIQEYVDDWLDAHPEATTTVPDDGITTRKLADGSVTRNKLAADVAHLLGGMMVTGDVQGEILSADDAYSVAPLSMEIDGKSTQDGTPTPENPVPIQSIEVLELPVTFAGNIEPIIANIPMQGHVLRSLPDGTCDTMKLSYLRESDRAGWAWYSRELVQTVKLLTLSSKSWVRYTSTSFHSVAITDMRRALKDKREVASNEFRTYKSSSFGWFVSYAPADSIGLNVGSKYILIKTGTQYTSAEDFIASLGDAYALYPLEDQITTQLDPVELPILPAPNCTVWSDPTTGLKMSYMRDANIVVSNIEQAIADL